MRNETQLRERPPGFFASEHPVPPQPLPLCAPAVEQAAPVSAPRLQVDQLATPLGTVLLVSDTAGVLRALDFGGYESRMRRLIEFHYGRVALPAGAAPAPIRRALGEYFEGELHALKRIAWATRGTPFQRAVWNALLGIPPGETRSYGELARLLGCPDAARAVGWANGSNPIALVVPCHRVIGASGRLTGYAGGLHRKHWLLCHEGARCAANANRDLFAG